MKIVVYVLKKENEAMVMSGLFFSKNISAQKVKSIFTGK